MKTILCLSTIAITIFAPSISIVHASETEISNNDFTRLVCRYLKEMDSTTEAVEKVKAMTELKINDYQATQLEEISKSVQASQDFCSSSLPKL